MTPDGRQRDTPVPTCWEAGVCGAQGPAASVFGNPHRAALVGWGRGPDRGREGEPAAEASQPRGHQQGLVPGEAAGRVCFEGVLSGAWGPGRGSGWGREAARRLPWPASQPSPSPVWFSVYEVSPTPPITVTHKPEEDTFGVSGRSARRRAWSDPPPRGADVPQGAPPRAPGVPGRRKPGWGSSFQAGGPFRVWRERFRVGRRR